MHINILNSILWKLIKFKKSNRNCKNNKMKEAKFPKIKVKKMKEAKFPKIKVKKMKKKNK